MSVLLTEHNKLLKTNFNSRARQPAYPHSKLLIGFAQLTEVVLGSLGGAVAPFAPY